MLHTRVHYRWTIKQHYNHHIDSHLITISIVQNSGYVYHVTETYTLYTIIHRKADNLILFRSCIIITITTGPELGLSLQKLIAD